MSDTLIVFDVDSTLLSVESLDFTVERALRSAPDGPERAAALSALTDQGMAGEIDFRTSLERRIAIAGLTRDSVEAGAQALIEYLTEGMDEMLTRLRDRGVSVFAVSGGFEDLIRPALSHLGFDANTIHANGFTFAPDGAVTGFDRNRPTSRTGGKAEVIAQLKASLGAGRAVMVGDGMTDFEAFETGAADHFIGFGGVVTRAPVKARAPAWAESVDALTAQLLA
ncbi:HAD-IB family phosphatase [Maricaulaceae bacterium EIL42A08]|nr:HAD-IB family phosphatase [Maricaulaceae bacterium EIL42A08]